MNLKLILSLLLLLPLFAHSQQIDQLILNRHYQEALTQLDNQISHQPSAALYFKKGVVLEKMMDFVGAIKALGNACRMNTTETTYLEELADANSSLGNYMDAIACLKQAVQLAPKNLVLQGKLAHTYLELKAYHDAFDWYQKIYQQDSTNSYYNRYYAYAAYKNGKLGLAAILYEQMVHDHSRDLNSYLNLATIYGKLGMGSKTERENFEMKAEWALYQGLKVFPRQPALTLKLGDTYFLFKDYGRAQHPYEQYLADNDSIFDVLKNYAICLYFTDYEKDALAILQKCYQMNLNDPIVNFYLGACYKKLKLFPESEGYLLLAIESATPSYLAEIYHHLGQVYGLERKYKESIDAYKKAMELDPMKVELLFQIATTYEEYNFNKTLALNYYKMYLKEAGDQARNADYALDRIKKIKEDLFFEK
ncbi:MAG TPA: tetratricopeptide repeat protein [Sunxiuqinia sp.]|nr:tetratricopeptide repeat protein [Sunxiuqinia sp.]